MQEDEPRPKLVRVTRHALGTWDEDDLRAYVAELHEEIARAETEMDRKRNHRNAADSFFRVPKA